MDLYSFAGLSGAIAHTSLGAYVFTGQGVGSITVAKAGENTAHNVAADGNVMVSKIEAPNGTVTITCQQNSELDAWLTWAFGLLDTINPPSDWAGMAIELIDTVGNRSTTATGVSFQKLADLPYQAQGQMVTWTLMAAKIIRVAV